MTNHRPLEDKDKWPTFLGQELNIPEVINWGQGAQGNRFILRQIREFERRCVEKRINREDVLVVIQFTAPYRFEVWDGEQGKFFSATANTAFGHPTPDKQEFLKYHLSDTPAVKQFKELGKIRLEYFSYEEEKNEFFMQAQAINGYLLAKGFNNKFFLNFSISESLYEQNDMFDNINWIDGDMRSSDIVRFGGLHDTRYFISDEDHHANGLGNKHLARKIAEKIREANAPRMVHMP